MTPPPSPSFSSTLKTLSTMLFEPLTPSASPRTRNQRAVDYNLFQRLSTTIKTIRAQETVIDTGSDDDEEEVVPKKSAPDVETRASSLIPVPPYTSPTMDAQDFRRLLLHPQKFQNAAERENSGVQRLFGPHSDTPDAWTDALTDLLTERLSWHDLCRQPDDADAEPEERLLTVFKLTLLKRLSNAPNLDKAVFFVDYVIRTIDVLKFVHLWKSHHSDKSWKTRYLNAACRHEHAELHARRNACPAGSPDRLELDADLTKAEKKFHNQHSRLLKRRKEVAKLYQHFGPGVLLDPTWDTINADGSPITRSPLFPKLVDYVCDNIPDSDLDENFKMPYPAAGTYLPNADSLYHILWNLTGSTVVSEYVKDYIEENPPNVYGDYVWTFGLVGEDE
ncbi:hypothetical protein FB45DRAFT_1000020 [Roridomyces roridus]|uniref:Uncharacterized protein n=1 Tax=Roridomyces roridus TaxID=1738132 RepID=A0AAD7C9A5_9AGAR|nr:hypothetical protein FB45DRAFT_1000020 [Roridomyces roridus]